ncbi:MAG: hypothetical protein XD63_0986 [Thermoanaerobacterales bacterium 50_218]|nr:MAG: hypothetical protein XD63_0986 [Thermoanaerobacterales bacterium 50_218]
MISPVIAVFSEKYKFLYYWRQLILIVSYRSAFSRRLWNMNLKEKDTGGRKLWQMLLPGTRSIRRQLLKP